MIRPILPKYLWDRIDRNLTTQGKGRAWENYAPGISSLKRMLFAFNWVSAFEGHKFWNELYEVIYKLEKRGADIPDIVLREMFQKHNIEI